MRHRAFSATRSLSSRIRENETFSAMTLDGTRPRETRTSSCRGRNRDSSTFSGSTGRSSGFRFPARYRLPQTRNCHFLNSFLNPSQRQSPFSTPFHPHLLLHPGSGSAIGLIPALLGIVRLWLTPRPNKRGGKSPLRRVVLASCRPILQCDSGPAGRHILCRGRDGLLI